MDDLIFEYEWATDHCTLAQHASDSLNRRTKEGWEFIQAVSFGNSVLIFYKRLAARSSSASGSGKTLMEILT